MAFRPKDLRWMVEESMTLSERLGAVVPGGSGRTAGAAGTRLRKWRERVASGDAARFDRRLRWDGLDTESALRLLGPVRSKASETLPGWARFLDAAMSNPVNGDPPAAGILGAETPKPFEDLLWRFVAEAARRMRAGLGSCQDRMTSTALVDLERGLLDRICRTAARALCAEFDAFRAAHPEHLLRIVRGAPARGQRVYRDFLHAMDRERLMALLLRYPMLARLIATCCQQWIASTVDLARRLDSDADIIRAAFGVRDRRLRVARVTPNLSDPHRGGRTVCLLRFESGTRLVYKPRPLVLDRRFAELLAEIARTCGTSATRQPLVLDRGNYGWVEFVEATPCADRTGAERFYRRAGMLACVVYALGGSDLHAGNLIASGEHPIAIDLECIVGAPLAGGQPGHGAEPAPGASPAGSVFRTGMPPTTRRNGDGVFRFVGGLADPDPRRVLPHQTARTNTDWMAWRGAALPRQTDHNLPVVDGCPQPASGYVDQLLDGFRLMYEALGRNRTRLRTSKVLRQLQREEFRVLIRDTGSYASLLENALVPQHLTSGPDWSIALDVITAPSLAATERPACWATRIAERVELERLDIPLFVGSMTRQTIRSSVGLQLEQGLAQTGRSPCARLALLNSGDLEQQLGLLRMSFSIADVKRRHRNARVRAARRTGPVRRHALVEIRAIVDLLKRLAVDDRDGVTWLGLGGPSADSPTLEPIGVSLFSGTSGIALFLASVAGVTTSGSAYELATQVFKPLCRQLEDRARRLALASRIGIGGAAGLGGLVYALSRANRLLGNAEYASAARVAASAITQTTIEKDEALDVLAGASGALLGLLAFHRATGDRDSLRHAVGCGEHLLERRSTDPATGLRAWRTPGNRLATGFAHGASGIAYALLRLAEATGRNEFRRAATEAWACEQQLLAGGSTNQVESSPAAHGSAAARRRSWCRGSAGIGLGRLGAHGDVDIPGRAALETAIESMPGIETSEPDGLCCGRMGHVDFLLCAGLRLERQDLIDAAASIGRHTLKKSLAEGRYATGTDEGFRPGLFQGVAGIGYELLRMHAPDAVPSVLLWE